MEGKELFDLDLYQQNVYVTPSNFIYFSLFSIPTYLQVKLYARYRRLNGWLTND